MKCNFTKEDVKSSEYRPHHVHHRPVLGDANVNEEDNDGCTALMVAARSGRVDVVQYLTEQCGADVNVKAMNGATAARFAADGGYHAIQRILTPILSVTDVPLPKDTRTNDTTKSPTSDHRLSCLIPPSEMELAVFSQNGNIGGDFQAIWLDADVVVKLFIPDTSHSSFDDEVRLWQRLRHPNVLKMYGACQAGPHLQFFVCEYASQGSLRDYVNLFSEDGSFETTVICTRRHWVLNTSMSVLPHMWKYLHEAALGLEYLHERGIVHGDLRCSNILIGSDGMAKLSNFALSGSTTRPGQLSSDVFRGTMRWQAPEILRGEPPSYMSDVYSLGMCLIEWMGQEIPWGEEEDEWVRTLKLRWTPESGTNVSHEVNSDIGSGSDADSNSDSDSEFDIEFDYDFSSSDFDSNFASDPEYGFQYMLWCTCCQDPHKRANLSSIVYKLARLAAKESFDDSQPELEPANTFDEYQSGKLTEAWVKLGLAFFMVLFRHDMAFGLKIVGGMTYFSAESEPEGALC